MDKTAIELFAGVGGFRVGLNHVTLGNNGKAIEENNFKLKFLKDMILNLCLMS